jgi:uncharacterized protein
MAIAINPPRANQTRLALGWTLRWPFLASLIALLLGPWVDSLRADVPIPPAPTHYFNDYANLIKPATVSTLNQQLADFERATSNQILVVIYPKYNSETSLEDFAQRAYRAWKVGQSGKDNGAILFVFVQDRKMRIQTGRGLEGALPDATCIRIIEDEIAPHFQQQDFDGGLTAGVEAMMAAAKGEFKGTGTTVSQRNARHADSGIGLVPLLFILLFVVFIFFRARRRGGTIYSNAGRSMPFIWFGGGGGGGGGGGFSGGGGGDGGGFSGGGGDSGGGGASGGW